MTPRFGMTGILVLAAVTCSSPLLGSAGDELALQERSGEPFRELSTSELAAWTQGRIDYGTPITIAQGLGPLFNKSNCQSCHGTGTIVGGPGTIEVTFFGGDDKGSFVDLTHLGGPVHQLSAISSECHEEIPVEASVVVNHITNGALAYGLVEAIADSTLLAMEDPFDSDGDGVSGRASMTEALEAPGVTRVGKFGWKAQLPTVLSFSADASLGEMGLTNRLLPDELAPNGDEALLDTCDTVADPEDQPDANGLEFIDRVTTYQRYLAPPPQTPKSGMTGEAIFNNVGCASCHTPTLTTADDPTLESFLRDRDFKPYGDFLLHCMGTLGDGVRLGDAFECEMKTPPLWGLRWRQAMLHDGRAGSGDFEARVTTAITEHGLFGEASDSMALFAALSQGEKDSLIQFLDSLGRIEFDFDGDEDVDFNDFQVFQDCFEQASTIVPDDACAIGDIDQDGDADLDDAAFLMEAMDVTPDDCDADGTFDLIEILTDPSLDGNDDGVLDACACIADINGDGSVGGPDLAEILSAWGSSNPNADIDGDGLVTGADLSLILANWGPCSGT